MYIESCCKELIKDLEPKSRIITINMPEIKHTNTEASEKAKSYQYRPCCLKQCYLSLQVWLILLNKVSLDYYEY